MSCCLVGRGFFRFSWRRRGIQVARRGRASGGDGGQPRVILSGVQPSGVPHLGNVFGAMGTWRQLQGDTHECLFCVADLHALTVTPDARSLRRRCRVTAAALLACGVDPGHSAIFLQSQVPEHTELSWILSCLTTTARLSHLHQWKEKSRGQQGSMGLLTYPVLQAADILLYRATHVPVGEDQAQHLELSVDLARAFNHRYGEYFPLPQAVLSDFPRIRSLQDPSSKMSKSQVPPPSSQSSSSPSPPSPPPSSSSGRPGSRWSLGSILLSDSDATVRLKVRRAVTDSLPGVSYDPASRPGVSNLMVLHAAAMGLRDPRLVGPGGGGAAWEAAPEVSPLRYKEEVAEDLIRLVVRPLRRRFVKVMAGERVPPLAGGNGALTWGSDDGNHGNDGNRGNDEDGNGSASLQELEEVTGGDISRWGYLGRVLEDGRERAASTAAHNLAHIKRMVGLLP